LHIAWGGARCLSFFLAFAFYRKKDCNWKDAVGEGREGGRGLGGYCNFFAPKKECCTFVAKKTHSALVLLSIRFKHIIGEVFSFFRSFEKKSEKEKSESIFSLFRYKCNRPIFLSTRCYFLWNLKSEMNFAWY
jgi:hypothetical protein